MIRAIRILSVALLVFNSTGALFGGLQFMRDPSGALLGMNPSFLEKSPFHDYFIPGVILFTVHGVMSLVTLVLIWLRKPKAGFFLMAQGVALIVWIAVQFILLKAYSPWQIILSVVGGALVVFGIVLYRALRLSEH